MGESIEFQVDTGRVLKLLAKEIYDSPFALLRENVQNAYDAVRQRFSITGNIAKQGRIDITIKNDSISIEDNGIGMDKTVLTENFWKPGSSGKQSETARKAGVVGTFGIGAMANFGICTHLSVDTRAENSDEVFRSFAERDSLKIGNKCIGLDKITSDMPVGTKLDARLDSEHLISFDQAKNYLDQYVKYLPVPVYLNEQLLSTIPFEIQEEKKVHLIGENTVSDGLFEALFVAYAEQNGQIKIMAKNILMGGNNIDGSMVLEQNGGQLMGFRSLFGLAPIPSGGNYRFGGKADLSFLQPTAGREALDRESIDKVGRLITLSEKATSELISNTEWSDKNNAFLDWIIAHDRYELAEKIKVQILPDDKYVQLSAIEEFVGEHTTHYYTGVNPDTITLFANENSKLLLISQTKSRKRIQINYIQNKLSIPQAPDTAQIRKTYKGSELNAGEASITIKIASILGDDYLIPNVDIYLADISHGVTIFPQKEDEQLKIFIEKSSALLPPLLGFYDKAYNLFMQFMKDFVRVHIYPRVQEYVPSSTRNGVDALKKILEQNRELYRYEDIESGDPELILGDYLTDNESFQSVLNKARSKVAGQSQKVSNEQVGTVEKELEDVVNSPVSEPVAKGAEFLAAPPIIRDDVNSDMKILETDNKYPQLNNFTLLLGLSDRLMKRESYFFRTPHTTKILWGGHRVTYIFTDPTGKLSLYYDIELKDQIDQTNTGGGMFPTTTIITKKRIFVPVPETLIEEFKLVGGSKEFFVKFDLL